MKDAECSEPNEQSIFQFIFFVLSSFLYKKNILPAVQIIFLGAADILSQTN